MGQTGVANRSLTERVAKVRVDQQIQALAQVSEQCGFRHGIVDEQRPAQVPLPPTWAGRSKRMCASGRFVHRDDQTTGLGLSTSRSLGGCSSSNSRSHCRFESRFGSVSASNTTHGGAGRFRFRLPASNIDTSACDRQGERSAPRRDSACHFGPVLRRIECEVRNGKWPAVLGFVFSDRAVEGTGEITEVAPDDPPIAFCDERSYAVAPRSAAIALVDRNPTRRTCWEQWSFRHEDLGRAETDEAPFPRTRQEIYPVDQDRDHAIIRMPADPGVVARTIHTQVEAPGGQGHC